MKNRKNRRMIESMDSIEPSDEVKDRMLANIRKKEEALAAQTAPEQARETAPAGRKRIWTRWIAAAACFALIVAAVSVPAFRAFHKSNSNDLPSGGDPTPVLQGETGRPAGETGLPPIPGGYKDGVTGGYKDGVIGERPAGEGGERPAGAGDAEYDELYEALYPSASYKSDPAWEGPYYAEEPADDDKTIVIGGNAAEIKAGTLTAGEWKDAEAISEWVASLSGNADWAAFVKARGLDTADFVKVTVRDGEEPCFNVRVERTDGGKTLFTARTDVNGTAYLFCSLTGKAAQQISVKVGETVQSVRSGDDVTIDAKDAGLDVTALDLLLMVDTTGSMGDELEYLKAELSDIVQRASRKCEALSIRVSVNFYRDEGDDYVVKYFDFRENIEECLEQIQEQHADGGGDYPEAVHTALDNAVSGHSWREEAVKLCFLVLDAPPHTEEEVQGVNESLRKTVMNAAEAGIRIIPVASSGVDSETEFLLRSYALITGGTYVFLTNDSGIGFGHKDPDVSEPVTVELLNDCMVRIICEYCGSYNGEKVPYTPPQTPYHQ